MHMLKGNNILGLKVIAIKNGKKINKVEDIIYNPKENKVKALLIDESGWFEDAKVILLQNIKSIGRDAVLIESEDQITKASKKVKAATVRDVSRAVFYYRCMKGMFGGNPKLFTPKFLLLFMKKNKLTLGKIADMLSDVKKKNKLFKMLNPA